LHAVINIIFIFIMISSAFLNAEEISSYPKIGLTLSGGGMRGLAHIGVLRRLEEENIQIEMISGASMGALVGGLYSLGYSSYEIEKFFKNAEMKDLFNNNPQRENTKNYLKKISDRTSIELDLTENGIKLPNALNNGQALLNELTSLVNSSPYFSRNFDQFKHKLRVVCSDIQNAEKVIFKEGDLPTIILGSMSFPGLFRPVSYRNMKLLDGGLTDNIPVDVLEGCDIILTSNTTYSTAPKIEDYNFIELLDRISVTMTNSKMEENLRMSDLVFTPEIKNITLNDIGNIDSLIALGYKVTDKQMHKLRKLLKDKNDPIKANPNGNKVIYNISGNTIFLSEDLLKEIEDMNSVEEVRLKILKKYKQAGYFLVSDKLEIKEDHTDIVINEGILDKIIIAGNIKTSADFIKDELSISVGNVLRKKDLSKSIDVLYGTDLFYNVSYRIDELTNCVCINVEEKPYNVLRIGAHYQTDRGYLGLFEIANKNMHGKRSEMYFSFLYGEKFNRVEASYYNIFMKRSSLFYELLPYYQLKEKYLYEDHKDTLRFYDRRAGINISLGFQMFNNYQGLFIANTEHIDIDSDEKMKTSIGFKVIADNRDDPVVPSNGIYLSYNVRSGWMDNNADVSFHKMWGEVNVYSNISNRLFYSIGFAAGTGDKLVPISERYSIGGMSMMPGTYYEEYLALQYLRFKVDQNYLLYSDTILDFYYTLGYAFNGFWDERLD
ncbi:MAG: patatin-like phospholipase family protein, partial [Candidatus Delongbacteria bacterium]|nr:patatin-like phospholipase family protein [Candidatus Delongbacteria bacterium]